MIEILFKKINIDSDKLMFSYNVAKSKTNKELLVLVIFFGGIFGSDFNIAISIMIRETSTGKCIELKREFRDLH